MDAGQYQVVEDLTRKVHKAIFRSEGNIPYLDYKERQRDPKTEEDMGRTNRGKRQ